MLTYAPTTSAELAGIVADTADAGTRLEIRGGGSKAAIGRPERDAAILDMRGFAGVIDYDPAELVLTVGAGTPLAEIEALVAAQGQMLAFEPFDHGPLFVQSPGTATIGGIVAAGVAGSRRLVAGGARDHLLGFAGVSGRGEAFVAGAKVVKNVTGYDVPKIVAGSWGRLVALTEITLKVLPAPRETATRTVTALDATTAHAAMARAMGSQAGVSGAVHLPGDPATTAFRIDGFGPSVAVRCALLDDVLTDFGAVTSPDDGARIWDDVRSLARLKGETLWRVSIPARALPALVARIGEAPWLADWAGGLVWSNFDGDPTLIRTITEELHGHATLVRAPAALRETTAIFQPRPPGLAALEARVRHALDPAGVFETDRFGDQPGAN